jgi:GntR family transcriptional regulator, transcriptional repressor for pyruvate dehydrogenase complex
MSPRERSTYLTKQKRDAVHRGNRITDEIIETLRQDIVTGRLGRGERLPTERELATHFGVSQPTMREVVRALDVMGLVSVRHGSGAYVRSDSAYLVASSLQTLLQVERVSIIEVLDVREFLGLESARMAATAATTEDIQSLEDHLARLERAHEFANLEDIFDELAGFQVALSEAAHHPFLCPLEAFLISLLLQIQIKALRRRGLKYWRTRELAFHGDRERIVDGLRGHDPDGASDAMAAYLHHQRKVFLEDRALSEMRFSDAKVMRAVSDIVLEVRGA